ncbi:hypothetical protein HALLA_06945 [Halostagnicola larsenii XH-48]|uniref:Uncharacterized protein n=1 Tax=Halostagnicola larsenii XH-48 TaxID=797299 RepID=W0JNP6_9EURY|nr:FxLYD domain-containing protein [Halostagnicola larsenii]AHF98627.1 hypothetical protein HALLA_06945 [Halostagnicola larsenii XH-48]
MATERRSRRAVLTTLGVTTIASLAGCSGADIGNEPEYEAGEIGEIDGESRTPVEMSAAADAAEVESTDGVTPLDSVELVDHEFVFEDGYLGSTVQGVVENDGADRVQLAEVRVRIYNENGSQIGQYFDTTGDLSGGDSWSFLVILLKPPADIADYDIAVLGTPA